MQLSTDNWNSGKGHLNMSMRITVADRLLIVAYRLGGEQCKAFSAEQLAVRAWKEFPESFGLRGMLDDEGRPEYPDSNRVFAEIMGSKPLRKRGLLEKISDKTYRLTEAGKQRASLLSGETIEDVARRKLDRSLQENMRRLFRTRAYTKSRAGRMTDITFFDACSLWGISPRSSAMHLEAKLAHIKEIMYRVKEYIGSGTIVLDRSSEVSASDIDGLIQLHSDLQNKFAEELDVIRQRTDERQLV